jgi:D-alanyl-D-alanine carboxypeptidase
VAGYPGVYLYGFGLMKFKNWIGHSGIISGYNSQVYYNPVNKITIIVYTNTDDQTPAYDLFYLFGNILAP